jgi:hypothetical protein
MMNLVLNFENNQLFESLALIGFTALSIACSITIQLRN